MNDADAATHLIFQLKGELVAQDVALTALARLLPEEVRAAWARSLGACSEVASTVLMNTNVPDNTIDAYSVQIQRWQRLLGGDTPRTPQAAREKTPA